MRLKYVILITLSVLTMSQPANFYGAVGGDLTLECDERSADRQEIYWFKGEICCFSHGNVLVEYIS